MEPQLLSTKGTTLGTETCTRSFRNRSLPAIALILTLLILLCWWAMTDADQEPLGAERPAGGGAGADSGSGTAQAGSGQGADAATVDNKPRGNAQTAQTSSAAVISENDVTNMQQVLPRIGFTPLEEAKIPAANPTPVAAPAGGQGLGSAAGSPGGSSTEFMGVKTDANRVVYILDFSGSMSDGVKIDRMLLELKKSVNRLPIDHHFYVIFFDDQSLPMPTPAMVKATPANKTLYFSWADTESIGASSGGGTDPSGSLELALKTIRPQAIYLMTDGVFVDNDKVFTIINRDNSKRNVQINTIALHDRSNEPAMQRIAAENHGEYRYVPPP